MNFLELINKCLLELNYKQVNAFSELVKNDHKRIMTILNIINKEVCGSDGWNFLLRKTKLNLPAENTELENTVNGRILYLFIDGRRHDFCENFEPFLKGNGIAGRYSCFSDKLLFNKFEQDKTIDVIYYTNNCVVDEENEEKTDFTLDTDVSLIPKSFAEQILVYGTCLRMKGNPQYYRFSYWMSMYKEALANLKSKSGVSVLNTPSVSLFRK
jgi:hypothetical protein